jgi:hypothetical protein
MPATSRKGRHVIQMKLYVYDQQFDWLERQHRITGENFSQIIRGLISTQILGEAEFNRQHKLDCEATANAHEPYNRRA